MILEGYEGSGLQKSVESTDFSDGKNNLGNNYSETLKYSNKIKIDEIIDELDNLSIDDKKDVEI